MCVPVITLQIGCQVSQIAGGEAGTPMPSAPAYCPHPSYITLQSHFACGILRMGHRVTTPPTATGRGEYIMYTLYLVQHITYTYLHVHVAMLKLSSTSDTYQFLSTEVKQDPTCAQDHLGDPRSSLGRQTLRSYSCQLPNHPDPVFSIAPMVKYRRHDELAAATPTYEPPTKHHPSPILLCRTRTRGNPPRDCCYSDSGFPACHLPIRMIPP